jgi:hypothetical protein
MSASPGVPGTGAHQSCLLDNKGGPDKEECALHGDGTFELVFGMITIAIHQYDYIKGILRTLAEMHVANKCVNLLHDATVTLCMMQPPVTLCMMQL